MGGICLKNNLIALVFHFLFMIISFIVVIIFVSTAPIIGRVSTHIISRIVLAVMFLIGYFYIGTLLDTSTNKQYDFLAGFFIAILGIIIWIYTYRVAGRYLFEIPKEMIEYWIVNNLYQLPLIFVNMVMEIPNIPIINLIYNFVPSLLIGLGLKYKRKIT